MTNENETFFQEVDESLRQEKLQSAIKRYGPIALGGFIALLAGVGAWLGWREYSVNHARNQSDTFAAAQAQAREGDLDAAAAAFEAQSTQGPNVYRVMAMMEQGALLDAKGDLQGAVAAFDRAADAARDPIMKSSARMRAAYIVADTQDFQALQARLQPIIDDGGQISFLARELLGVEAWEAGEEALARETLEGLTLAFDVPDSVRQRAQLALSVLGPAPESETGSETAPERETTAGAAPAPAAQPESGESK